ncbi:hypothetical protein [Oleidesulfovibrio sp.]|uniref:hypothetical protein n=1 Tax=Oleidesulfovibrio sp. TaxID=2909707 RepID=UPI003A83A533
MSGTLIALLGLGLSLYGGLFQAEALCITSGCDLFRDITIAGISPWWIGAAAFASTAALCIIGRVALARLLSLMMLLGDLLLLGIMTFTVPCLPCLIVAAVILWQYWNLSASTSCPLWGRTSLALLWLTLFSPNLFSAISEMNGGWSISGQPEASLQVYFSPSCPACKETMFAISQHNPQDVAFYPIAEADSDLIRLHTMQKELASGSTVYGAFRTSINTAVNLDTKLSLTEQALLKWKTLQNKARLARMGVTKIPALITSGKPQNLTSGSSNITDTIIQGGQFAGCSDESVTDCNEEQQTPTIPTYNNYPEEPLLEQLFDAQPLKDGN